MLANLTRRCTKITTTSQLKRQQWRVTYFNDNYHQNLRQQQHCLLAGSIQHSFLWRTGELGAKFVSSKMLVPNTWGLFFIHSFIYSLSVNIKKLSTKNTQEITNLPISKPIFYSNRFAALSQLKSHILSCWYLYNDQLHRYSIIKLSDKQQLDEQTRLRVVW